MDELEVLVDAVDLFVDVEHPQRPEQGKPLGEVVELQEAHETRRVQPELLPHVVSEDAATVLHVVALLVEPLVEADEDVAQVEGKHLEADRVEEGAVEADLVGNDEEHAERDQENRELPERHEEAALVEDGDLLNQALRAREVDRDQLGDGARFFVLEDLAVHGLIIVTGLFLAVGTVFCY